MSIGLVTTAGFGNGTLSGTIIGVVLRGYGIGEAGNTRRERIAIPALDRGIMMPNEDRAINVPGLDRTINI